MNWLEVVGKLAPTVATALGSQLAGYRVQYIGGI